MRLALQANPGLQAQLATLEASRSDLIGARSGRYPSLGLTGSASRYNSGETSTADRHNLGLSLRQTLYQGGRVSAGVDAAESVLAADKAAIAAARSDLILAVRQAWYHAAQAQRLVISSEQGLERSRLNLEYAEAQLLAGLGTRPDVLRARVDVSAAALELTRSHNAVEGARTTRQEAAVRFARGGFLPTVNADAGLNWGATGSQSPSERR